MAIPRFDQESKMGSVWLFAQRRIHELRNVGQVGNRTMCFLTCCPILLCVNVRRVSMGGTDCPPLLVLYNLQFLDIFLAWFSHNSQATLLSFM